MLRNRKELPGPPPGWKPRTEKDLPKDVMDQIVQIYRTPARPALADVDNSNTQFALLALWVARRHGVRFNLNGRGSVFQLFESAGLLALFDKSSGGNGVS